jgi:hypothetical protein
MQSQTVWSNNLPLSGGYHMSSSVGTGSYQRSSRDTGKLLINSEFDYQSQLKKLSRSIGQPIQTCGEKQSIRKCQG